MIGFLFTLLTLATARNVGQEKVVKLAVLAPSNRTHHQSLEYILPAVQLATKAVTHPATGLLPRWIINVNYRDSNCSSTFGPLAAFDFYHNGSAGKNHF